MNPNKTQEETLPTEKELTLADLEEISGGRAATLHKVCDSGGYCEEF